MQWTVRYFTHKSKFWSDNCDLPAGQGSLADEDTATLVNVGAVAYSKRKHFTWDHLALKADRTFKNFNNAYKSPL
jgi:hypothetical protein